MMEIWMTVTMSSVSYPAPRLSLELITRYFNITATFSKKSSKQRHGKHPFHEAEDGRMIIEDLEKPAEGCLI